MQDGSTAESLTPLKRAILEIRDLRARLDASERQRHEPMAIVGMGMRFPGGANDPESYWQLLKDGVDAITPIPGDRWSIDDWYDADPMTPGKMYTRHGGFLTGIDRFAADFFSISRREAESLDPQQRMLMEVAWEALEHAGQAPSSLHGSRTGVFVGLGNSDYIRLLSQSPEQIDVYFATGSAPSIATGRLSYLLGLQGPAVTIDTACSSSLTAVHLACQSLRSGESDMALAGGVNAIVTPEININFSKSRMMAEDGRCKTFDARADGYVRGEGCGIVVLKRLSDALAHGDQILAVIRGSAVNQDGRSNGITAPNGPSQVDVIRRALAAADLTASDVAFVETHGTGTSLGDPIEVQAIDEALCRDRPADRPLLLGAVKTNIGHLEAASGVAGLMKTVLALQHGEVPANLHFETPNPLIAWERTPISVVTQHQKWPEGTDRRIAGVSSFGFSGTNAHIILESAPPTEVRPASVDRPRHLLPLSARSESALGRLATEYRAILANDGADLRIEDLCFTAGAGRSHFAHRVAVSGISARDLSEGLAAYLAREDVPSLATGWADSAAQAPIAFLFTGHGAQYVQMGRQLLDTQPQFRATMERCDALLAPEIGRSLLDLLYSDASTDALLDQMVYAQPALFAIQYALAQLWRSWGIEPTVVLGHSIGEYAAACVAGLFSLEDGIKLTAARGRLLHSIPAQGSMAAVFASHDALAQVIAHQRGQVSVAAYNAPDNTVISGSAGAVTAVLDELAAGGIESRRLRIAQASHSPLVDPIVPELVRVAETVTFHTPQIALVSSATGRLITETEAGQPGYWGRHLRQPVRFAEALQTVRDQGCTTFVEIGPHPVLIGMAQRSTTDDTGTWVPSLRRDRGDWEQLLESVSALYVGGAPIDWEGFDAGYQRRRISLPTYPWERQRYWADWVDREVGGAARKADPLWPAVSAAALRQAEQAPLGLAIESYPRTEAALDRLASGYITRALVQLGLFSRVGETQSIDAVMDRHQISTTYRMLLERWFGQLVEEGSLVRDGGSYLCVRPLSPPPIDALERDAEAAAQATRPLLDWVMRCGGKLLDVVTGQESALETLFPGGSYDTVDYIYHAWPLAQYFNNIVRTVAETSGRRAAGRPLRILEIGAGTGGTTATVLPALSSYDTTYHFTDVSDFFLARARERFAEFPFVQFGLFDVERPPEDQGIAAGTYDLVVASNAIHAARDLDAALLHARSLLAPGGVLALFEATRHPRWLDVTTGLIAGWQRFDDQWRGDNPLLSPDRWNAALRHNGFDDVLALPHTDSPATALGHHVILALGPNVRQESATGGDLPSAGIGTGTAWSGSQEWSPTSEPERHSLQERIRAATADERHELLVDFARASLRRTLRLDTSVSLERTQGLMDLGIDSLMAVELRDRLMKGLDLRQKLSATLVFDYPTVDGIATYLGQVLVSTGAALEPIPTSDDEWRPTSSPVPTATRTDVTALSDTEVEALLLAKLNSF